MIAKCSYVHTIGYQIVPLFITLAPQLEKVLVLMSRLPPDSEFAKQLEVITIDICMSILLS